MSENSITEPVIEFVEVVEPKEFFMVELNSKQRKFLEKEAHNLSPVVIIGGAGVTEGLINMVASSIASHELIKVKFNEYKDEKKELTEEILEATDTTLVRMIGNVIILYKPAEKEENQKYAKQLAKLSK